MPRVRTLPISAFGQKLMDEAGVKTLKELATKRDIPYETVRQLVDPNRENQYIAYIIGLCDKLKITPTQLIEGIHSETSRRRA